MVTSSRIMDNSRCVRKKAIIYISFHPGTLEKYAYMRQVYAKEYLSILIICQHPYINAEIIKHYVDGFDQIIVLPDVQCKANIYRLILDVAGFLKDFKDKIKPILAAIDQFDIISNASGWLPVNILLSRLRHSSKCNHSISLSDESDNFYGVVSKSGIDILKTGYLLLLSVIFRIYPAYYHKKLSFVYIKLPVDRVLRFNSPFLRRSPPLLEQMDSLPVYNVLEPFQKRSNLKKEIVIIYGDTTIFKEYGSDLTYDAYKEKLTIFFSFLSKHYHGYKLIYKPHPLDKGKIMPGLDKIRFELYEGSLISQLHLDMNIDKVKACYSAGSFSLHYPISRGIPAYAFYKYLEFNRQYPDALFKKIDGLNPFFWNIRKVEEIGVIDSTCISPSERDYSNNWVELLKK